MIFSRLFDFIYKKTEMTSVDQLLEDFGEYPPSPLSCNTPPDTKVYKVIGNRLGYMIYRNKDLLWIIKNASNLVDIGNKELKVSAEATSLMKKKFSAYKVKLKAVAGNIVNILKEHNIFEKFIVLLLLSPVILLIMSVLIVLIIPFVFLYLFIVVSRAFVIENLYYNNRFSTIRGEHQFIADGKSFSIFTRKFKGKDDAVVSHENLHVLQNYQDLNDGKVNRSSDYEANLNYIVLDKYLKNDYVQYLFDRREVEARLHEVVLIHYRSKKFMPLDVSGFKMMVLSYFLGVTDKSNVNSISTPECRNQSDQLGSQLHFMHKYFKKDISPEVFLSELLAPMYANLLKYYGDTEASEAFRNKIESDELYQKLYGWEEIKVSVA